MPPRLNKCLQWSTSVAWLKQSCRVNLHTATGCPFCKECGPLSTWKKSRLMIQFFHSSPWSAASWPKQLQLLAAKRCQSGAWLMESSEASARKATLWNVSRTWWMRDSVFFGHCLSILCWIPDDSSSVHVAMWLLFDSLGKTSKSASKKDKIEAGQMEEYISHASLGWSLVLQVD